MNVLLLEPNYHNKYPPLGLMKISTFHKSRGDAVSFFKGTSTEYQKRFGNKRWNRIYISTLFTYQYNKSIEAINLAKKHTRNEKIYVGGVAATLLSDNYLKDVEINTIRGLLNAEGKIGLKGDSKIDKMIPDYSILDEIDYKYPTNNAYIGYTTRGCVNKCPFCAVPILEPKYCHYFNLKKYVKEIKRKYGEKKDLLLLDNNVLASERFEDIIKDIKDLGFERDAKTSNGKRKRYVDFNQGLDARKLNEKKAKLLSEIAIRPARIAFDHIELEAQYRNKVELMAKYGVLHLSNYLLYNFNDKPKDLYKRIKINIQLNEDFETKIFSFPMKFIPLNAKDRSFVGKYWTRKQLRAIQTILHATHGVVGPKREFNERAFGETVEEFETLLWMPEEYIMYREEHERSDARKWREQFENLSKQDKKILKEIIKNNEINISILKQKANSKVKKILKHYGILQKRAQTKIEDFSL
ncbi:MAG: cobalamin-binding domain-containing protein [Thermoplasmata archaeon]|nr:cobalamin-binding domain-containing protein [Thermoplasmata archaeon]